MLSSKGFMSCGFSVDGGEKKEEEEEEDGLVDWLEFDLGTRPGVSDGMATFGKSGVDLIVVDGDRVVGTSSSPSS